MIRLTAKNVIALHKQMIEKTGGSYGVRDEGLLESALASPFMTYDQIELFPSVYQKAARLCFGFVKNHPFIDGNKRIGTQLMLILLKKSGIELFYTQEELIEVILHVADGTIGYEELLTWCLNIVNALSPNPHRIQCHHEDKSRQRRENHQTLPRAFLAFRQKLR